jgi:acyl-CoA thioester hydrolase
MKRITEKDVLEELKLYKHMMRGQVKFHEVDSFGVVHNIQYFYFLEWARTKYLEFAGMPLNDKTYTAENPIMTVHHEMDYFNPLYFNNNYEMYSRVRKIKNSSMIFDNIITNEDGRAIVKASVVLVYLSNEDYKPARVPQDFRDHILQIEGENVEITD